MRSPVGIHSVLWWDILCSSQSYPCRIVIVHCLGIEMASRCVCTPSSAILSSSLLWLSRTRVHIFTEVSESVNDP